MIKYTLGFLFNSDLSQVVLIEKTHPDFQKGLYNGIGGIKNESPEGYANAHDEMSREFEEETGVSIRPLDWVLFGELTNKKKQYHIYVFYFVSSGDYYFNQTKTLTKEIVRKLSINFLLNNQHMLVSKTLWLILMAIENYRTGDHGYFRIEES